MNKNFNLAQRDEASLVSESIGFTGPFALVFMQVREQIPPSVFRAVIQHRIARQQRANGACELGEYAIPLFSELLSASLGKDSCSEFVWQLVYEHSLIVDDLLDEDECEFKRDLIIASQVLLDAALVGLQTFGADRIGLLLDSFARFRLECWHVTSRESASLDMPSPFSQVDLLMHGRKAALAKFAALLVSVESKNQPLSVSNELMVERICSAVQLQDDIDDLNEDFSSGRKNYPLELLRSRVGNSDLIKAEDSLLAQCLESNVIDETLTEISRLINAALPQAECKTAGYWTAYLRQMATDSDNLADEIRETVGSWCREDSTGHEPDKKASDGLLGDNDPLKLRLLDAVRTRKRAAN